MDCAKRREGFVGMANLTFIVGTIVPGLVLLVLPGWPQMRVRSSPTAGYPRVWQPWRLASVSEAQKRRRVHPMSG
jgi:hypothetical protein